MREFSNFASMRLMLVILLIFVHFASFSQEGLTYFGVQFKPLIPSDIFSPVTKEFISDTSVYRFNQNVGYSFGAIVRHDFKKWLSLETGISYTKRRFSAKVNDGDTATVGLIGYEIPILGLVYVRLSRKMYMDAGFGLSFDMFPSDVSSQNARNVNITMVRRRWITTGILTNVGWEYRTKEKGSFYVGGSYHLPFRSIFAAQLFTLNESDPNPVDISVTGNYLTIDFRYFFPGEKKDKKEKLDIKKEDLPSWMNKGKK